mmetsp:Transcript_3936/g.6010  ORF Transcript_3936/g.6010 Transcript_3936/m.6010 type:complete len:214 (+) Transcript_3936:1543-2184(+)
MSQCSKMLRHCTFRSLLLIDEFGKGTNPIDGASLVVALIRYLSAEGKLVRCKALLTLHFLEIFRNGLIGMKSEGSGILNLPNVSAFHMEVHIPEKSEAVKSNGKVDPVPLFKLVPGVALSSHSFSCARLGNLPEKVIQRAMKIMNHLSNCMGSNKIESLENIASSSDVLDQSTEKIKSLLSRYVNDGSWMNSEDETIKLFIGQIGNKSSSTVR